MQTGLLFNDTDPDGQDLSADIVTVAEHGSVVLAADGSFSYTPDTNFFGEDSFTYRSSDGTDFSNIATVMVTVSAVADAPVAETDSYSYHALINQTLTVDAPVY